MIDTIFRALKFIPVMVLAFLMPARAEGAHRPDGVTLCMPFEPTVLDPTIAAGQNIREIVHTNIFEGLAAIDRDGKIVPALAESWERSADGLHYTFHLRQNAFFHDGMPFTAEDVKFTFARAMSPDSKNIEKWIFEPIKSVEARGKNTVEITLNYASGLFVYGLAWGDAVIFSQNTAMQNAIHPVGTGPYKFKQWRRGDRLVFERNEQWWGGSAQLKTAIYRFISDQQAIVNAMLTGDCDLVSAGVAPELLETLRKNPELAVSVGETEGETILAINNARKPFDDVRVRRALSQAIDRKAVIEGAMSGYGTPIGSHFSPSHPAYVDLTTYAPYDPEKARALLAEAGYLKRCPPNIRCLPGAFSTTISVPPMAYARRSAEIIAEQLKAVGISATLIPLEFPQWLERVYKNKDYDLSIIAHTEPLDIKIYANPDYYFQYKSEAFRDLIKKVYHAPDEKERDALLKEAQKMLAKDAVNVFLFELPKITLARKGLNGAWKNWPMALTPLAELSWQ
jgi:peptide/nickel transport system substrate-binding protein